MVGTEHVFQRMGACARTHTHLKSRQIAAECHFTHSLHIFRLTDRRRKISADIADRLYGNHFAHFIAIVGYKALGTIK